MRSPSFYRVSMGEGQEAAGAFSCGRSSLDDVDRLSGLPFLLSTASSDLNR
jgi:hypothetical protein